VVRPDGTDRIGSCAKVEAMHPRDLAAVLGPRVLRDVALVVLADAFVGFSFGAIAVGGGLPVWVPIAMSALVFAGGAQFAAVAVLLAGGDAVSAILAGLVLNTRLLPFGFAVARVLGPRLPLRLLGAQLVTDETVAFALAAPDPRRRRAVFWTAGIALFVAWNAAVAGGALVGAAVGDTDALGLDAAFPAVLLALVLPALRGRALLLAAASGAIVAVLLAPVLPPGLPVLVSLVGLVFVLRSRFRGRTARDGLS
jgi:predicted branched-subunit amino acid permease